jgi:predicted metal-dependent hydrolase
MRAANDAILGDAVIRKSVIPAIVLSLAKLARVGAESSEGIRFGFHAGVFLAPCALGKARDRKGKPMRQSEATRSRAAKRAARRELLRIEGKPVPVIMKLNRRARRLIVKVHPSTGEVTVVAPSQRALDRALDFARSESTWIARRLARVPQPVFFELGARIPLRGKEHIVEAGGTGPAPVWIDGESEDAVIRVSGRAEHAPRRLLDFLKREARAIFSKRAHEMSQRLGLAPSRITIRDTASRWGSCSTARALSFSWRLIFAPDFVIDYVIAHEVAHMRHMNHGQRFWKLVEELVGDIATPQKWLARNGPQLHRYAPRVPRI